MIVGEVQRIGTKILGSPVLRWYVAEEIRVEGRDDSCLHTDIRNTIITRTAYAAIVISIHAQVILICKLRGVAYGLEIAHKMHLFFGVFLAMLSRMLDLIILCTQVDQHCLLPKWCSSFWPRDLLTVNCFYISTIVY